MIEILAVLGFPLAGAAVLALIGERRHAPAVNVAVSFLTFAAAVALTADHARLTLLCGRFSI